MWFKLMPFVAVVFVCKARSITLQNYYIDNYDYPDDTIQIYNFRTIIVKINCGEDFTPYSTKVRSEKIYMLVCTNSSYEGYDPSYYKDTVLDQYNISSNAMSFVIAFGSKRNSSSHTIKRKTIFGLVTHQLPWGTLNELQELNIVNSNLRTLLPLAQHGPFRLYTSLSTLDIRDTPLSKEIIPLILKELYLKELTMRNCSLYYLPDNFIDLAPELTRLDLSHNHLLFVPFESAFRKSTVYQKLEFMDLSYNDLLHGAALMYTVVMMPRLRIMILDNNPHLDMCKIYRLKQPKDVQGMTFSELRKISASFTGTSSLCFGLMKADNLVLFNISYSMVSTLSLQGLPAFTAANFTMDLRGNNVTNIELFGINEYEEMKSRFTERNKTKATVLANVTHLQCDCQYSWLQKALKDISNLKVQDISCSNEIQLIHQEWDRLNCTKFICGDCHCRRGARSTTVNCSSGLTSTIPMEEDLSHIYAASNRIESLNASLFSDKLIWVDISANRISRLDLETITGMFSKEDRHFRLAGNPIICDCTNQALLRSFRLHRHQVYDYKDLSCAGSGNLLNGVNEDQLCDNEQSVSEISPMTITIAILSAVVVILALIVFIDRRCTRQRRVLEQNDDDDNIPYDVLILFTYEDEKLFLPEFLTGLEKIASVHKFCVHLRDWIPGDMVSTEIIQSIERSRNTHINVSKRLMKALLGSMEFQTEHVNALTERRMRIVVVLFDNTYEDVHVNTEPSLFGIVVCFSAVILGIGTGLGIQYFMNL